MAKSNEVAIVRDSKGKKIGSIQCPQKPYKDALLYRMSHVEYHGYYQTINDERQVWKNPDAVVLWAWHQVLFATKDEITNNNLLQYKPFMCVVCNKESVSLKRALLWKNKVRGIACGNPSCPMFKVIIPGSLFDNISSCPNDILAKLGLIKIE